MPSQTTTEENSAAGVIPSAPWRIQAVTVLPNHGLALCFQDGRQGIVDCSGIKSSEHPGIYAPLANLAYFTQVRLALGALTWPNGASDRSQFEADYLE